MPRLPDAERRRRALLEQMGDATWTRTDVVSHPDPHTAEDLAALVADGRVLHVPRSQGAVESWTRA